MMTQTVKKIMTTMSPATEPNKAATFYSSSGQSQQGTTDRPGTDMLDEKQTEAQRELEGNHGSSPNPDPGLTTSTQDPGIGDEEDSSALTTAMISNLNYVSHSQLDTLA